MKNLFPAFLIVALFAVAVSCGKDSVIPEEIDHSKDFLKELKIYRSDRTSPYFIRGEFDGKLMYFTYHADNDRGWNTQFVNPAMGVYNMTLLREDQANAVLIAFHFQQADIFNRQLPYTVASGGGEFAELHLTNLRKAESGEQGLPQDDINFVQTTSNALKIELLSLKDSILEGRFEGYISSKAGSTILVKNGNFRIKINVEIY
jgi:hypothetical protein